MARARSAAQVQSEHRYEHKKQRPREHMVGIRVSKKELELLLSKCKPGEGKATALKRLAGITIP